MPYHSEFANPLGYEPLLRDSFLADRLKTYSLSKKSSRAIEKSVECLAISPREELDIPRTLDSFKRVFALDGSLAEADENFPFEITALKLGFVLHDLDRGRALLEEEFIDSEALRSVYKTGHRMGIIPGRGVYDSDNDDDWKLKFRKEFYVNAQNISLPGSKERRTILDVIEEVVPLDRQLMCLHCKEMNLATDAENVLPRNATKCPRCLNPIYITDALFFNSAIGKSLGSSTMLAFERLLMHGVVTGAALGENHMGSDRTLFVIDGPLGLFDTPILNAYLLSSIQALPKAPIYVGFEKGGEINRYARRLLEEDHLLPGEIAMYTDGAYNALRDSSQTRPNYFFGKRFFYRTEDASRIFVFSLIPSSGFPYEHGAGDGWSDSWENYPHARLIADYIEAHSTLRFGPTEATLDVIAEANHAASLPKTLSEKFLNELISEKTEDTK